MSTDLSNINYIFLAVGLLNGVLFVVSETVGFLNKHTLRSKSVLEIVLRKFKCLREPSLDEILAHFQHERSRSYEVS